MLCLNHTLQLTIEKLVYGGDGLARLPTDEQGRGKAVFMPFVLANEIVEANLTENKPGYARARADTIQQASPLRVEPLCPYFQSCGGCHYQHTGYEHQLEIKAAILKENLRRIAKLELNEELRVHPSPAWHYRNRSRLKIRIEPEFALGYFKFNSHELLPVRECPISSRLINRAITEFWKWGPSSDRTPGLQEVEFFANADDSELLIELYGGPEILQDQAQRLSEEILVLLPEIKGVAAYRQGTKSGRGIPEPARITSCGASALSYKTEKAAYRVSVGAFFQVNRHLINELAGLVVDRNEDEVALDLYAGVGLFSSLLARRFAQVIAVESSQISYSDLIHNSPANVKAIRATTEQFLVKAGRLRVDLVVVDPPRGGLGSDVVKRLSTLRAPHITYVSCDPATLARDLSGLQSAGYRVQQAHLVDLFPQTFHLESIFHLVR